MRHVDFVIGNTRHHAGAILPLVRELVTRGVERIRVLSLCELRGEETPVQALTEAGAEVVQLSRVMIPKRGTAGAARDEIGQDSLLRRLIRQVAWVGFLRRPSGQPDVAVIPNDAVFPYDRIAKRLRHEGTPFILLQEGIRFELPSEKEGQRYGQGGAAAVAAWGPAPALHFARTGVDPARIHPVGSPWIDRLASRDWGCEVEQAVDELGVDGPFVLYASNTIDLQGFCTPEEKYAGFANFLTHAEPYFRAAQDRLVVKLHPGEQFDPFEQIVAHTSWGDRITLCQRTPIHPLIDRARAVLVLASTVGLEAILLGRPVGLLPIPTVGYSDQYPSAVVPQLGLDYGLAAQLAALVQETPDQQRRREGFAQSQVSNFGDSTSFIADLIEQVGQQSA